MTSVTFDFDLFRVSIGGIEVTGRQVGRRKQLLDDFNESRSYCKLKKEALDRTVWRTRSGRGYGSVVRQTTE